MFVFFSVARRLKCVWEQQLVIVFFGNFKDDNFLNRLK